MLLGIGCCWVRSQVYDMENNYKCKEHVRVAHPLAEGHWQVLNSVPIGAADARISETVGEDRAETCGNAVAALIMSNRW